MKELENKILSEGIVIGSDILKVGSFINHKIDTDLLFKLGEYFSKKFDGVTKILTIEASGIAFAVGVARRSATKVSAVLPDGLTDPFKISPRATIPVAPVPGARITAPIES